MKQTDKIISVAELTKVLRDLITVRISLNCSSIDLLLSTCLTPRLASTSCFSSAFLSKAHASVAACLSSLSRSTSDLSSRSEQFVIETVSDLSLASSSDPGEGVALK